MKTGKKKRAGHKTAHSIVCFNCSNLLSVSPLPTRYARFIDVIGMC